MTWKAANGSNVTLTDPLRIDHARGVAIDRVTDTCPRCRGLQTDRSGCTRCNGTGRRVFMRRRYKEHAWVMFQGRLNHMRALRGIRVADERRERVRRFEEDHAELLELMRQHRDIPLVHRALDRSLETRSIDPDDERSVRRAIEDHRAANERLEQARNDIERLRTLDPVVPIGSHVEGLVLTVRDRFANVRIMADDEGRLYTYRGNAGALLGIPVGARFRLNCRLRANATCRYVDSGLRRYNMRAPAVRITYPTQIRTPNGEEGNNES